MSSQYHPGHRGAARGPDFPCSDCLPPCTRSGPRPGARPGRHGPSVRAAPGLSSTATCITRARLPRRSLDALATSTRRARRLPRAAGAVRPVRRRPGGNLPARVPGCAGRSASALRRLRGARSAGARVHNRDVLRWTRASHGGEVFGPALVCPRVSHPRITLDESLARLQAIGSQECHRENVWISTPHGLRGLAGASGSRTTGSGCCAVGRLTYGLSDRPGMQQGGCWSGRL
jgi:hypothetical protein